MTDILEMFGMNQIDSPYVAPLRGGDSASKLPQGSYNCCMTLSRTMATLLVAMLLMPLLAFAQEEDILRSTIRADIMSDPRSAEMSPTEIDALVNALAMQAQEQGIAQDYLDAQSSFEPVEAPIYEESASMMLTPLDIALLALIIILAGVVILVVLQRNARRSMPPSDGMVA